MTERRVIAVVGPTASGKSELALGLAASIGGEIVNADSRQIYRRMDIGTAKPSAIDRARVPHHLYDVVDPTETYSLALYQRDARAAFEDIWARGRSPVIVGGTGQYVWGLLEGWTVPEVPPDEQFRAAIDLVSGRVGAGVPHRWLGAVDPIAAERIDARNVRRVARALEVFGATGVPISTRQAKREPDFEVEILGVLRDLDALDARIVARTTEMFARGFVVEVRRLLDEGVSPWAPSMSSIGYADVIRHLAGELSLDEAVEATARATRRLARRQSQWFRPDDPRIVWRRLSDR